MNESEKRLSLVGVRVNEAAKTYRTFNINTDSLQQDLRSALLQIYNTETNEDVILHELNMMTENTDDTYVLWHRIYNLENRHDGSGSGDQKKLDDSKRRMNVFWESKGYTYDERISDSITGTSRCTEINKSYDKLSELNATISKGEECVEKLRNQYKDLHREYLDMTQAIKDKDEIEKMLQNEKLIAKAAIENWQKTNQNELLSYNSICKNLDKQVITTDMIEQKRKEAENAKSDYALYLEAADAYLALNNNTSKELQEHLDKLEPIIAKCNDVKELAILEYECSKYSTVKEELFKALTECGKSEVINRMEKR